MKVNQIESRASRLEMEAERAFQAGETETAYELEAQASRLLYRAEKSLMRSLHKEANEG